MALEINLNVPPYFNDYDEKKRFYRMLWQPETAVQTREMNQFQDYFQTQIERLGNNLFKRGTVIDGCNFIFYDDYPYAKIEDVTLDGENAVPENYVGYFVKNSSNLVARVIDYEDGFESSDPDLKTIYLKYVNSGNSYTETAFSSGQILTVYDSNSSIHAIDIVARGSGYSNSDVLVITPQLLVNVTSGSISVGDTFSDPALSSNGIVTAVEDETTRIALVSLSGTVAVVSTSANVNGTGTTFTTDFTNGQYVALYSNATAYDLRKINKVVNTTFMNLTSNVSFTNTAATYANTSDSRVYVSYRPLAAHLANTLSTSNSWSFEVGSSIVGSSPTNLATVISVVGENAAAELTTDSVGRIDAIDVTNRGDGYFCAPIVSVKTAAGASANLIAENYAAQVTVSSLAGSTGSGYAFGVTEGVIYQKGYMVYVEPQTIIIDKYSKTPDDVTVGFVTVEDIVDANEDTSLFDNVLGYSNRNAPGADRLRLTPTLDVRTIDEAASNTEFFDLVEWSDGYPYKQNQRTAYNVIEDKRAEAMNDQSGSFVVDRFLVTTTDPVDSNLTSNTVSIVIDPGTAYIDGSRVQTLYNYSAEVSKSTATLVETNSKVSLNYENYVRVQEVGGFFEFDSGNSVQLWSSAKGFISNTSLVSTGNTTPQGTQIGTARIRNFVFEQGTPGTPGAIYRMYLFDIVMNGGSNFRDARSVYYAGTIKGIADIVLTSDSSTSSNIAAVVGRNNRLVFPTGFSSPLVSNNINYTYRTIDETQDIANTGVVTISLTALPNKTFPYTGTLSDAQKSEIYLAPQANLIAQANLTGTINVTSTSNVVTGNASDFVTQLKPGQFVYINGGGANVVMRRVTAITNSTYMTVDSNVTFTSTSTQYKKSWPANIPIALAYNTLFTANVNGTGDVMNIYLGDTIATASNTDVIVAYNVEVDDPTPAAKTPNRSLLVKIRAANNAAGKIGPWCLGVPDIFRLRNVYVGDSSVSTSSTDITDDFFIDHNQNSNYYSLGYLYKKKGSSIVLTDDDYLLVQFDAFTASPGFYTVASYVSPTKATRFAEDAKALANLSSTVNTFEIPEMWDDQGNYYDLINQIDFRPYVTATANVTANLSLVTLNPANTVTFSATDRYFPVPDTIYRHDVEYFTSRVDSIILDKSGAFSVLEGVPGTDIAPNKPAGSMLLNTIKQPTYPSIPDHVSSKTSQILNTRIYSNKYNGTRVTAKTISTLFTDFDFQLEQPMRYTESDIGSIDRRLRDVEYYVAFTLLQSSIRDRVFASSISPNIDRFKYGFYVDDFSADSFSDIDSPEWSASLIDDYATPLLTSFNTVHVGDNTSAPYTSEKILFQGSATDAPVVIDPPPATEYDGGMTIDPTFFKTQSVKVTKTEYSANTSTGGSSTSSSSNKSSKIVCTAMNEEYGFGAFRQTIWLQQSKDLDPAYEVGYHAIFLPMVDWAYRSEAKNTAPAKVAKKVMERVARKRTADIWKQKRGKIDLEGRIYRTILEPLCFVVGKLKG